MRGSRSSGFYGPDRHLVRKRSIGDGRLIDIDHDRQPDHADARLPPHDRSACAGPLAHDGDAVPGEDLHRADRRDVRVIKGDHRPASGGDP